MKLAPLSVVKILALELDSLEKERERKDGGKVVEIEERGEKQAGRECGIPK